MDLGLKGKKAIVVGGARGIGYSIAELFAREGCDVAITARNDDSVKDAVADLRKYGTKVIGSGCDVSDAEGFRQWMEDTDEKLGGCDILVPVTSASGGVGSLKYWEKNFAVDVMGPVRAIDAVIEGMKERGEGSIVMIGTTSALEAMGGPQAYNALKASLIIYGKQLGLAHGKDGIRVNVVSPGPIEFEGGNWEMLKGAMEKYYNSLIRKHPQGRFGKPEEIARCVGFLASPAASWCNGSHLVVDGGFTDCTHF